jgi:hypothetical protein
MLLLLQVYIKIHPAQEHQQDRKRLKANTAAGHTAAHELWQLAGATPAAEAAATMQQCSDLQDSKRQ